MMFAKAADVSPHGVDIECGGATNLFLDEIPGELTFSVVLALDGGPRDLEQTRILRLELLGPSGDSMGVKSFPIGPEDRSPAKPPHLAAHINWVVDVDGFMVSAPGWYRLSASIDTDTSVRALGVFQTVPVVGDLLREVEALERRGYVVSFHPPGTYALADGGPAPAVATVWREGEGATTWFGTGRDVAEALKDVVAKLDVG